MNKIYPEENVLPEDGLYRYLYQPSEEYIDQKWQATEFICSKNTVRLDQIIAEKDNCVFYCLQDGFGRIFGREESMYIQEDTKVPSAWVSKWKYQMYSIIPFNFNAVGLYNLIINGKPWIRLREENTVRWVIRHWIIELSVIK